MSLYWKVGTYLNPNTTLIFPVTSSEESYQVQGKGGVFGSSDGDATAYKLLMTYKLTLLFNKMTFQMQLPL